MRWGRRRRPWRVRGEGRAIVAVLTWFVLSFVAIGIGRTWGGDHGGGTAPDPINVGTAELGVCQEQWTGAWHCEVVSATWGEGRTPRDYDVHAGSDVSGRTVGVEFLRYSTGNRRVVVATGPDAPIGNLTIFIYTPLAAAFSVAVAAALVMIGRVLDWIGRRRSRDGSPETKPAAGSGESRSAGGDDSPGSDHDST